MWKNVFIGLSILISSNSFAQLVDGSVAPDFTLTDYYGSQHHLYSYLDSGKTVFIEFFAAHCPGCWNYHQTNTLKDLYTNYGPPGTDEVMVLALEYDEYNDSNAFTGNHSPWVTQGDWLTGTPYPIFNVEGADRSVFNDYNVTFYPIVYKICPDRLTERVSTSLNASDLYQKAQSCPPLSVQEINDLGRIYIDQFSKNLMIDYFQKVVSLNVLNLQGQLVKSTGTLNSEMYDLSELTTGIYIFQIQTENGSVAKKLFIQ